MRAAVCMCMLYRVANAWFVEAGFASRFASFAQVDLRMTFGFAFDQRPPTFTEPKRPKRTTGGRFASEAASLWRRPSVRRLGTAVLDG